MQIKFGHGLAVRVGAIIAASALFFLTVFSIFFYQHTVQSQIRATTRSLSQLVVTVESSAKIASYLNNKEIATEVIEGLARNDMVLGVAIRSTSGLYLTTGDMSVKNEIATQHYTVFSPVDDNKKVGQISIAPNQQLIELRASNTAKIQVWSMAIQTLMVVALVMVLVYWQLTKPIHFVARQLHTIEPGSTTLINYPSGHHDNEIGKLVYDTNQLLETVRNTIEKEQCLRAQVELLERRFRVIFEHASGGIALTNLQGKLLLHNPSFKKLIGNKLTNELIASEGKCIADIFVQNNMVQNILNQIPEHNSPIAVDLDLVGEEETLRCLHSLFSSVKNEQGDLLIEIIFYDISERAQREKQVQIAANHDPLTKLLNRRGGLERFEQILEKCRVQDRQFATLMVDLDKFKPVNDTFGHEGGDKVLCEIAERMLDTVRQNDLVMRLGGDEFLIVLTEGHAGLDTETVAQKVLALLGQGIDLGKGQVAYIGGSIGISLYPEHGDSISMLVDKADDAMYNVKIGGRNGYCFADQSPYFPDQNNEQSK